MAGTQGLALLAASAVLVSVVLYFALDDQSPHRIATQVGDLFQSQSPSATKDKLFTKEELKQYDGKTQKKPIYLAILGDVFDVTAGDRYYGPEGGYSFFAGIDATRAYVTGEFNPKGLREDFDGLDLKGVDGITHWHDFFITHNEYRQVGRLIGYYYDKNGQPTAKLNEFQQMAQENEKVKKRDSDLKQLYPPCNTAWDSKTGSTVWCTEKSGGIQRSWRGYPRQLYDPPGSSQVRCACAQDSNDDNPALRLYPGCKKDSEKCFLKK